MKERKPMRKRHSSRRGERGFTLVEMMIAVLLLTIIIGAVFQQVALVQQRSVTEQAKLDVFQEAREFMDQMSRDLHQAGFPSPRQYGTGVLAVNPQRPSSPYANDSQVAVGVTKVDVGDLWFEGDVTGDGTVSVVQYHLDAIGTNCPCLRRSQQQKTNADPLAQPAPQYQAEVQNVQNGTAANPIFFAYQNGATGTAQALPVDFNNNSTIMANIDTIKIVITIQSPTPDPQTGQKPITTLVSTVRLNNCSAAQTGQFMSC